MVTLEVSNLSVKLNNRSIINNITFSINAGILAVLGQNGVGKTTLLKSIAGILKRYTGDVLVCQKSIFDMAQVDVAKLIAFVPQEHHPSFPYRVEEVVLMGRTPYLKSFGFPSQRDWVIMENTMEHLGITHLRGRIYTQLSGGERRLVLVAMALCQQTDILILDEPTTFLDVQNSYRLLSLIVHVATKKEKIVIVTMHDINHALACADNVLMIYDSNEYVYGKPSEIINENNLKKLYQINFEIINRKDGKQFVIPNLSKR